ncbi:MAG: M1 family metallopeptidase [Bacteroidales bacterium]
MKKLLPIILLFTALTVYAQRPAATKDDSWKTIYRATPERINDLVNTRLEVSFDFQKSQMPGKAWITLRPHYYPTDSLTLDAKSMAINEVAVIKDGVKTPLKFFYNGSLLRITLDKTYKGGQNYVVYIDYVAKPEENKSKGSAAINDAKGLYFVNPLGKDKDKPVEVWTQGETESNSGWFPTIDKPNQKMTDEISMTVPSKFVTLSNGLLVKQKKNADGTRTDTWKMDLPHSPYLVMMAVGEYSVIKDKYKNKEVSYYVEKEYAPVAKKIFGLTPEMITFFSQMTGVDYPWQKYSQVAVRNYISGAMENTTATVHGEGVQQDARELIDGNSWEETIAHELFHMWFGDYVTTESWSNLTINESWAVYGAFAWAEYKHGKDGLGEQWYNALQNYLFSNSASKDLVRFYYRDKEEMFDAVSYQKGGCILYMLRNFVGDSAFNRSIKQFLTTNKFSAAEAHQLRLSFEEVTGKDLNWFFNQWYFGSGHPKLDISYDYDATASKARVFVKQNQKDKIFRLPVAVDVYQGGSKKRYQVWAEHAADTFSFPVAGKPDLINFDGDKMLVCEKVDHKTTENFAFQYKNAGLYLDRREAIDYAANKQKDDAGARAIMKLALSDRFEGLREYAIQKLNMTNDSVKIFAAPLLSEIARKDESSNVRAAAISALGRLKNPAYRDMFLKAIDDSSYSVAGSGLTALGNIDTLAALNKARELSATKIKGRLQYSVTNVLYTYASEDDFDKLADKFVSLPFGGNKFNILQPFANYLKKVKDDTKFRKGIDYIADFRDSIPEQYMDQIRPYLNGMILNSIAAAKDAAGMKDQADYVKSKIASKKDNKDAAVTVPDDILRKYQGDYDINGSLLKVTFKDSKGLFITFPGQGEMELIAKSKNEFKIKYMDTYEVEFLTDDKGETTALNISSGGEKMKADKKKQ